LGKRKGTGSREQQQKGFCWGCAERERITVWHKGGAHGTHLNAGDGSGLDDAWADEDRGGKSSGGSTTTTAGEEEGDEEAEVPRAVWSASCDMVRNASGWWWEQDPNWGVGRSEL